jgi:hypothetical protein
VSEKRAQRKDPKKKKKKRGKLRIRKRRED